MDLIWSILAIFFFAGIEELIKLGLVVAFRNTQFRIQSYFLFFALESISKIPGVYDHTRELGASSVLAVVGTFSVILSSTSFHIFTSVLYAKARWIWMAVLFCTIIHFASNFMVQNLPTLSLYAYILLYWPFTLTEVALLFAFYCGERYIRSRPLN